MNCPYRRALAVPGESGCIIHGGQADLTSGALRKNESEGHACRARGKGMDYPTSNGGPDERGPPLCGLEDRVPPTGQAGFTCFTGRRGTRPSIARCGRGQSKERIGRLGSIRADGKVVKAKAFTKKRR